MAESPQGLFSTPLPGAERGRLHRALTLSAGTHAAAAIVLALMATRAGMAPVTPPTRAVPLVWTLALTADESVSRGTGGGGEERTTPARTSAAPRARAMPTAIASPPPISAEAERRLDVPDTQTMPSLQASASGLDAMTSFLSPIALGVPESRGPGDGPGAGEGRGRRYGPGGESLGSSPGAGTGDGRMTPPFPIRQVRPQYTTEAVVAKVQGAVTLEVTVLADGSVGPVRVVKSLDPTFGLDQKAIETVRQWRFAPGRRDGRPIPMLVLVELTFTLR